MKEILTAENYMGRLVDYGVILSRAPALYGHVASELNEPRLLEMVRDGCPVYAWPYEERHEPGPRGAVEGLDREPLRQQALHVGGLERPVHERQALPPLPHDRPVNGERAGPCGALRALGARRLCGHRFSLPGQKFSGCSGMTSVMIRPAAASGNSLVMRSAAA